MKSVKAQLSFVAVSLLLVGVVLLDKGLPPTGLPPCAVWNDDLREMRRHLKWGLTPHDVQRGLLSLAARVAGPDMVRLLLPETNDAGEVDAAILEAGFRRCSYGGPSERGAEDPDRVLISELLRACRAGMTAPSRRWRTAQGAGLNRMSDPANPAVDPYVTTWRWKDADYFVALRYHGILGGGPYGVCAFDSRLDLVRTGEIDAPVRDVPYALVEVRHVRSAAGETEPWRLAVVTWELGQLFHEDRPCVLNIHRSADGLPANVVHVSLVVWDHEYPKPQPHKFFDRPVEVRWAETGSPLPLLRLAGPPRRGDDE